MYLLLNYKTQKFLHSTHSSFSSQSWKEPPKKHIQLRMVYFRNRKGFFVDSFQVDWCSKEKHFRKLYFASLIMLKRIETNHFQSFSFSPPLCIQIELERYHVMISCLCWQDWKAFLSLHQHTTMVLETIDQGNAKTFWHILFWSVYLRIRKIKSVLHLVVWDKIYVFYNILFWIV